jgi:hypothetical protein
MSGQGYQTNSSISVLTVNASPSITSATPTQPTCNGGNNGQIAVVASGANTLNYSDDGTHYQSGSTLTGLTAGTYTVYVKDTVTGCVTTLAGVVIGQPTALSLSLTPTNPSSCGGANGSIQATFSGGTGTLQVKIDGGTYATQTSPYTFTGLSAGLHTVYLQDGNSCSNSQSDTLSDPSGPSLGLGQTPTTCNGGSDGQITATFSGNSPFQVNIDGGSYTTQTSPYTFTGLTAGSHTVTVRDNNGCTTPQLISVTQPTAVVVTLASQVNETCNGGSNGSITINTATGGSGSYTYNIDGGSYSAGLTFSGLTAGSHTITAKDSAGCVSAGLMVSITQPAAITLSPASLPFGITNVSYSVTNNTITAANGVAPYTYAVTSGALPAGLGLVASTGAITGTPTTASSPAFTVTATDGHGCTGSQGYTITIGLPAAIAPAGQPTNMTACSGTTASFTVAATGSASLSYAWRKNGVGWGTGNAWTFTPTNCSGPNDGYYIGDSSADGSNSPAIGTAYGLYAANGNSAEAVRSFTNLTAGQSVVIDYQNPRDMATNAPGTQPQFALRDSSGVARFQFYFNGGDNNYTINDSVISDSGIGYTSGGLHLVFTLVTADTYNLQVTRLANTNSFTYVGRTLGGTPGNALSQMRFFYRNSGGGMTAFQDFFFNVLSVGGYSDNAANYSPGACGTTTWTNNSNLGQGPLFDGGTISGSATPTLQVSGFTGADSGSVYSVIVYNPYGAVKSGTATLNVNATPTITTGAALPGGTNGVAYSKTLASSGGTGPYTYSLASGSLPGGLSLSGAGVLSGIPSAPVGTYNFTIYTTDSSSTLCAGSNAFSLAISCPAINVAPLILPNVSIGAPYNQTVVASGGAAPYTYSVSVGSLPAGLFLNATSGSITGTYTGVSGSDSFTITATDTNNCPGSQAYTVQMINCPMITLSPGSLPGGTVNVSYSQQITASGGTGPYTYSEVGALPAGVTLSSSGLLAGTPTQTGTFNITVTAIDSFTGCGGSQAYSLVIGCQGITVTINGAPGGSICAGMPVMLTASSSNTIGLLSYAWTKNSVPIATTQSVTDYPAAGNPNYVVTVTDTNGCSGLQNVGVIVNPGVGVSVQPSPQGVCSNSTANFSVTASGSPTFAWQKIGTGWGSPWSFSPVANTGTAGFYIGTSTNAGAGVDAGPGIDSTNHSAFGLYANSGNTAAASRTLNPQLSAGQTFEIDVNNGDEPATPSASVGFNLFTGGTGGTQRFEFAFRGGGNDYVIADASGNSVDTGVHYTTQGLHVVLTMTSSSTYTLEIAPKGTNEPISQPVFLSGTLAGAAGSIDTLRVFNFESAGFIGDPTNPQRDAFFNNIQAGAFDDAALNYTPSNWTNGSDKGDAPLANGATGNGSTIVGADTSSMNISNVSSADVGSYDVVVYNLCGLTNSTQAALTISATSPVTITAPSTVCGGSTNSASVPYGGAGATYAWTITGGTIGTGQGTTGLVFVAGASGTVSLGISVTNATGCVSTGSATVAINALPTVSVNSATICSGVSTTLTATSSAASPSYLWSPGGATTQSITVSPASTTIYTVTVTDGSTSCANSGSGTVTVNLSPTVTAGNNGPLHVGDTLNLTATSATAISYSWTGPNGFSSSVQDPTISNATAAASGLYTVTVTDGNGCQASASTTALVTLLHITSITKASGNITITWTGSGGTTDEVQFTTGTANGSYTNNFTDIPLSLTVLPGSGAVSANYTDVGGATNVPSRFYRVRLVQ